MTAVAVGVLAFALAVVLLVAWVRYDRRREAAAIVAETAAAERRWKQAKVRGLKVLSATATTTWSDELWLALDTYTAQEG